jgi:virulence-associated protein VapD
MFLPDNIDLGHSDEYNLSIRLTPNGFSFYIHSPSDPSIFHFQETSLGSKLTYLDHIKKVIFDLGFFSQVFHKTAVTIVSDQYTLVPDAYFDRKKVDDLYRFNFHNHQGVVLSEKTPAGSWHILFQIQEEMHAFLLRNLWNPVFCHHASTLLQLFGKEQQGVTEKSCFVDFHDSFATIVCFDGDKLLSANTVSNLTPLDTTYFIASMWEKLHLSQTTDRLYLSGKIEGERVTIDTLKKLIRNVEYLELHPKVMLTETQKKSLPTDIQATLCVL